MALKLIKNFINVMIIIKRNLKKKLTPILGEITILDATGFPGGAGEKAVTLFRIDSFM